MHCTAICTTTFLNELYCSGHVSLFCLRYVTYMLTKESEEKKDKILVGISATMCHSAEKIPAKEGCQYTRVST